jgi:vacuolar protein sorting-associated protein 13A/C
VQATKADVFFEAFALQPVSLELSFMRTDRVNVDEK